MDLIEEDEEPLRMAAENDVNKQPYTVINDASPENDYHANKDESWKSPAEVVEEARQEDEEDQSMRFKGQQQAIEEVSPEMAHEKSLMKYGMTPTGELN